MACLDDLNKSISEMDFNEGLALIKELRALRRQTIPKKEKKTPVRKKAESSKSKRVSSKDLFNNLPKAVQLELLLKIKEKQEATNGSKAEGESCTD